MGRYHVAKSSGELERKRKKSRSAVSLQKSKCAWLVACLFELVV